MPSKLYISLILLFLTGCNYESPSDRLARLSKEGCKLSSAINLNSRAVPIMICNDGTVYLLNTRGD